MANDDAVNGENDVADEYNTDDLYYGTTDDEQRWCMIYDKTDFFTIFVQMLLACFALGSLYFKRLREVPRRTFSTWFMDVFKQGLGACYAHIMNMVRILYIDTICLMVVVYGPSFARPFYQFPSVTFHFFSFLFFFFYRCIRPCKNTYKQQQTNTGHCFGIGARLVQRLLVRRRRRSVGTVATQRSMRLVRHELLD